jgi:hypothetical protein
MCQAVFNTCPRILDGPKAVPSTTVEVLVCVTRASKCDVRLADPGVGIRVRIGHGVRSHYRHHCDNHCRSLTLSISLLPLPQDDVSLKLAFNSAPTTAILQ